MNGPIRRVAIAVFVGFFLLILNVTYIQALATSKYRDNPLNPRVASSLSGKERGVIITADGTVVAQSMPVAGSSARFTREYPEGPVYAHVVGYTSLLFGDAGLERAFAADLRSKRDLTVSDVISALMGNDLRPHGLQLTIDAGLQQAAFDALGDRRGAIVALDPSTGAVLAMVSKPSFDPSSMLTDDAAARRSLLLDDPQEPLANRAIARTYPPASTFKVIVAAGAIEQGVAGPETEFPDPTELPLRGTTSVIRNYDRGPCMDGTQVTLSTAFRRSCNTIFAMLGIQLGADELAATAESFEFNTEVPFELAVQPSVFPPPQGLDEPALAQSSIGQRDVRATPLEMAMVASAIANNGLIMEPHVVSRTFDADGQTVSETSTRVLSRAVSPAIASIVAQMMERVVASGTGTRATVPNVRVAGKTGTAETETGSPDVWFISFAPVDAPTIALSALIEDAGENATGGSVAAPIAQEILSYWLRNR